MTTVYRVEHPTAKRSSMWIEEDWFAGPYQSELANERDLRTQLTKHTEDKLNHPTLAADYPHDNPFTVRGYFSGFASLESASEWFSAEDCLMLDKYGFKIYQFESESIKVGVSNRQILFRKAGERKELGSTIDILHPTVIQTNEAWKDRSF